MKKVGILTFHRATNYGACLQAFALKKYLEQKKCDCEIINYKCDAIENFYNKVYLKDDSLKTKIKKIITWPIQKKRNKKFKEFIEKELLNNNLVEISRENVSSINSKYDLFIVGSDQVWSPLCTNGDRTFLLDFVDDNYKKASYAACLGVVNKKFLENDEVRKLLNEFNSISVREKTSVDILKQHMKEDKSSRISVSLDPTFLLKKEQWNELIGERIDNDKYIFVYSLSMPKEIIDYANNLSVKTGFKIIYFTLDNLFTMKNRKNTVTGTPIEFLNYLKNAEYVVTNSFHGTAFSIILNKDFFVLKNSNPKHDNSRLENVMNEFGLSNRLLAANNFIYPLEKINFNNINENMDKLRESSLTYIDELLK